MKKLLSAVVMMLLALAPATSFAQKSKDRKALFNSWNNYEVTTVKVGTDGTKFIKVWGFGKKVDLAIVQAKKNAVHACLFRGLPGVETANATPPLCPDPGTLTANEAYFTNFFETAGEYLKYVNMTTDGVPSGQDRRQVKGGYKVAIYAQVMYDNLRDKLEADGIIRKLSTGF